MKALRQPAAQVVDLGHTSLRELNASLHAQAAACVIPEWRIVNPLGAHAVACGINAPLNVTIDGHVGYYCAGMNQLATVRVNGNAGTGIAENMMSGHVVVSGDASQSAGASGCGGLLVVAGNASSRCGISMKGIDIVVGGSIGHMGAFMAQAGNLVVLGDVGDGLGDSIYEAQLFVRGSVKSRGADCVEKALEARHVSLLGGLLARAGYADVDPRSFRRFGSARRLYNFHVDNVGEY